MGANSKIEWTDHTFSPWIGCTKVSPACDHCYAETLIDHRLGQVEWGGARKRTSASNWAQPLRWNKAAQRDGVRRKVFCASLADVFDNQVPEGWRFELWLLINRCRALDWLLLTKRPQNIAKMLPLEYCEPGQGEYSWPWPHVWLGTTVENQEEAERRLDWLCASPGHVLRFVSCEPLLGPVDLTRWLGPKVVMKPAVNWVICGGESGPHARPMDPVWARVLRDQCRAAGVPYFFKQWGEWHPDALRFRDLEGRTPPPHMKIGKKKSGRLLDGREHSEFPA